MDQFSYCDNEEQAPHFPHPALMSFARMPAFDTIAPSGSRIVFIQPESGAG
jgi:hypothetical protein